MRPKASSRKCAYSSKPSNKAADEPADKPDALKKPAGSKRSLTFAIGGVLTLLSVAGYTFLRQPSAPSSASVGPAVPTPLESVASKREIAKQKLDGLTYRERREEARRLGMLTEEEVDAILGAKENTWSVVGQGMRLRVDANQVSSNEPIEDYMSWKALQTNTEGQVARYMFGVFDGHAGYMCAEQIAARIGPMLDSSLEIIDQLSNNSAVSKTNPDNAPLQSTISRLRQEAGLDWDHTSLALTATFINMDHELVHGALAKYRKLQDATQMEELLGPAVSGSCGIVAVVDTETNEVVVANTGDSRALLGVRLKDGRWKAVRLSEDQTAKNPNESVRMSREHPNETVIVGGRVLGALMPTRAFGDCRYKWPLEAQQDLFPIMHSRGHRYATTPRNYLSPPYVTAKPVIVRHQLNANDKFVVIASDGLYDQLSDAEVVDAVAQWYEANQEQSATLVTQDKNAATHLIRSALSTDRFGRRSDTVIRRLLAIPPPHSRRFRDDISVTIITLDRDQQ
ncbi:hypothetical protein GGI25_005136 [Coemansia spiralis]|uniref:PPM-type phosphatase domain-containing protein n=2 Tax=Coemansia TaxID=4863 RepID=A0A9W8G577_9FUNG|nr:hypothetical protein EDC05_005067 [Coemansia umbellata]KAJ2620031.1 hypothetical protein GGI26_005325 [Coemansia sp. RSA 1358]KAJ2672374.1 hypothetical protein GGI25_005136 [Coemansia spiralis]